MRNTLEWLVSDDCDLDVFGFLPLFIRGNEDGRSTSKIDRDPKKYGYILLNDKPWEGEHMNFTRACELVSEFKRDPRTRKKVKISAATWIGRILNLKYSIKDIYNFINDENLHVSMLHDEINLKSNKLKSKYYTQLMKI